MNFNVQIVATIGPATKDKAIMREIISHGGIVARLNFSWGTHAEHEEYVKNIRETGQEMGKRVPIIQDLSGPRMQEENGHKFNGQAEEVITPKDLVDLKFSIKHQIDYVALSYVGGVHDVLELRSKMQEFGRIIPIIAKIERKVAINDIDKIIQVSDAIMVARGDLGNEVPIEQIPFIQKEIIGKCKVAGKPVIVATQMMTSMVKNSVPTRAEVTDVAYAVLNGADAVMLSEETAIGKYPAETVAIMTKVIAEAEKYLKDVKVNSF